jgi:CDP-glucose 4,6-dehydratase
LLVGRHLLQGDTHAATSFNFGPAREDALSVRQILQTMAEFWPGIRFEIVQSAATVHEAGLLSLDNSKAAMLLKWHPIWRSNTAIERTIGWYKEYYSSSSLRTDEDIKRYCGDASEHEAVWIK